MVNQELIAQLKSSQSLTFSDALYLLRAGENVCRASWSDIKYIALQKPDEKSKMKRAYLYAVPKDGQAYPYSLSNTDLFLSDWSIYKA
jgi:hypothetical protein